MQDNLDQDLQEAAWAEMAIALLIRAAADARGRIDKSEGNIIGIQKDAIKFLCGETPEYLESKKFWIRVSGIDEYFFDTVLLPKLLSEDLGIFALESRLEELKALRKTP